MAEFWLERAARLADERLTRTFRAMTERLTPPKPPGSLREEIMRQIAFPEQAGREDLMGYLKGKYGMQADFVAPYIMPQDPEFTGPTDDVAAIGDEGVMI